MPGGRLCAVPGCSTLEPSFRFPSDERRRYLWETAIEREQPSGEIWRATKTARICGKHFHRNDFSQFLENGQKRQKRRLKETAVPRYQLSAFMMESGNGIKRKYHETDLETDPKKEVKEAGCQTEVTNAMSAPHSITADPLLPILKTELDLLPQTLTQQLTQGLAGAVDQAVKNNMTHSFGQALDQGVDQAIKNHMSQFVSQAVDTAVDNAVKQAVAQHLDQAVNKAVKQSLAQHLDPAVGKAVKNHVGKTVSPAVDIAVNKAVKSNLSKTVGQAVDKSLERAMDNALDKAVDKAVKHHVSEEMETALEKKVSDLRESFGKTAKAVTKVSESLKVKGSFHNLMLSEFWAVKDQIIMEGQSVKMSRLKTLDFFIENWSEWKGSNRTQYSRVWYLPGAKTHLKAEAYFTLDNKLRVGLAYGRHARVMGLRAADECDFKVTATLVHLTGGADWTMKEVEGRMDEGSVLAHVDGWRLPCGLQLDVAACDEVERRGLVGNDKVLVRLELTL